ncbi:short-chain dehydrogenase [Mycolicibacterium setense]|uniref:SDR family oxidoreductase n=1 Tax=Mycolicibacterium setense TaxID=431269 RepID=UPI0007EB9FD2|nr:SDR family oxidoreductase [Mycolicibacterium setense]OBB17643.1 short-chain dehydrogenase [Mycolicibacterium setense]
MSELRFDDRVAVITGAGNGLGRAYALLLAGRGARVVVNDLGGSVDGTGTQEPAAEAVVAEIRAAGGEAVADTNNVASADGGQALVANALDAFGKIDILINNAGILRDGTLHKMSAENFDSVVAVHLRGSFYVTQPAFVHMRERGYGRIVNTTSAAGLYGNFGQVNYSAAKMGLVGMTKSIAAEGKKYNIHANVVAPIAVSRMTQGLMAEAMQRLSPDEVAPVVAYLVHESCDLSGQILSAYGGHVGSVFVAETRGINKPGLSVEDVAASIDQILDADDHIVPSGANEAIQL